MPAVLIFGICGELLIVVLYRKSAEELDPAILSSCLLGVYRCVSVIHRVRQSVKLLRHTIYLNLSYFEYICIGIILLSQWN